QLEAAALPALPAAHVDAHGTESATAATWRERLDVAGARPAWARRGEMPGMERPWTILVLALTAAAVPAGARERVVHLKVGPFRIEARRDREVCQAVRIPHARGLDVVAYETRSRTAREVGTHHFIAYGYQGAESAGFPRTLVDDPGCKNGHPRFRYSCTHANGSAYEPVKMGCERQP